MFLRIIRKKLLKNSMEIRFLFMSVGLRILQRRNIPQKFIIHPLIHLIFSIKDSLNIRSQYEQNAFLDVIIDSPYYSDEIYGSKSFMRAQWVAHNTCYDIASRGNVGFKVMQILSGAENPIQSANSLDLRSKNNMLLRQKILYTVISWLC